jgi:hypothetical protein
MPDRSEEFRRYISGPDSPTKVDEIKEEPLKPKSNKAMFRRHSVDFEAVKFTGENHEEIQKLVGSHPSGDWDIDANRPHVIQNFHPIGTYLPEQLFNKEPNPPAAELWRESVKMWRPVYIGDWIVSDNDDWITVPEEWLRINCIELNEEMAALIREMDRPKTFQEELESLLNRNSMENDSGTPDFILAAYLQDCLTAFNKTVIARAAWRGEYIQLPAVQELREGKRTVPMVVISPNGRMMNEVGEAEIKITPGEQVPPIGRIEKVIAVYEPEPDE